MGAAKPQLSQRQYRKNGRFFEHLCPPRFIPSEPQCGLQTPRQLNNMSTDRSQPSVQVYQLKVVLRDCSPMIWRRLLVTSDTTIAQLHTILQIAMGWEDLHLHRFRIYGK